MALSGGVQMAVRNVLVKLAMVCLAALTFACLGCGSQPKEPVAKIKAVSGDVKMRQNMESEYIAAEKGMTVIQGGFVKTGDLSSATIEILNKGTVQIKSDVVFQLTKSSEADVIQESGIAIYSIGKDGRGFKAKTPQGVSCVLGTVFAIVSNDSAFELWVKEGQVEFTTNLDQKHQVKEGQKLVHTAADGKAELSEPGLGPIESFFADDDPMPPFNMR